MRFHDYYTVLGVSRNATQPEIRAAFRDRARSYHAGAVAGEDIARTRFRALNEAYEVLGTPGNRNRFDALGMTWKHMQAFTLEGGSAAGGVGYTIHSDGCGFSDFFENLFGYHHRLATAAGDYDVALDLYTRLDEVVTGSRRTLTFQVPSLLGQPATSHTVRLTIPIGAKEGFILKCPDLGEPESDTDSSDLMFQIRYEHHPEFDVEGINLIHQVTISADQARAGTHIEVPTLTGTEQLSIPPDALDGTEFKIAGEGLPSDPSANTRGDICVRVSV